MDGNSIWTSLRLTIQGTKGLRDCKYGPKLSSHIEAPSCMICMAESYFCSSFLPLLWFHWVVSYITQSPKQVFFDASPQDRPGSIRDGTQCHAHRCGTGFLRSNGGIEPWYCWKRSATTLGSWGIWLGVVPWCWSMETHGEGLIPSGKLR